MRLRQLALLLLFLAPTQAHATQPRCSFRIGPMVPTKAVAREVAEAIIRGRQTSARMATYVLHVEQDADKAGQWLVWQALPESPPTTDGALVVHAGGGGMTMRIDKCTGKISEVHYTR